MDLTKFKFQDVLSASPFDYKFNLSNNLSEEIFFDELFILKNSYERMKILLENHIDDAPWTGPFFCFVEGYAGTGKTTFARWFCRETCFNNRFAFLDLENNKSTTHKDIDSRSGISLFEDYFIKLFSRLFKECNENIRSFLTLIKQENVLLSPHFAEGFKEKFENCFLDADNKLSLTDTEYSNFLNQLLYTELLLLYLLYFNRFPNDIIHFKVGNINQGGMTGVNCVRKKNYDDNGIFLFIDNIDSMVMESDSVKIPMEIAEVYWNYYIPITMEVDSFPDDIKFYFIFLMRDSVYSIINPQHNSRFFLKNVHFSGDADNYVKVYRERENFSKKYNVTKGTIPTSILKNMLKDEIYTRKIYLPLFNFNYKKFSNYFLHVSEVYKPHHLEIYNHLLYSKDTTLRVGSRGIMIFYIIRELYKRDFISTNLITKEGQSPAANTNGLLNIARIILTIILNQTEYALDVDRQIEKPTTCGLFDIYVEYSKLFPDDIETFMQTLLNLFLFYDEDWCHLLTFYNCQILDQNSLKHIQDRIVDYELYCLDGDIEKSTQCMKEINKIQVRLNSSGYIYLKDIIRHYEFHSIKANNSSPLFTCIKVLKKQEGYQYEFEDNIKNTMELAFSCINTLSDYMDNDVINFDRSMFCFRAYSNVDHIDDEFDFAETNRFHPQGQLLLNRIIDSHTNYLDSFRRYLLSNQNVTESISKEVGKKPEAIKEEINQIIARNISEYIKLYFINKPRVEEIKKLQLRNLKNIQANGIHNQNISLNDNRDYRQDYK